MSCGMHCGVNPIFVQQHGRSLLIAVLIDPFVMGERKMKEVSEEEGGSPPQTDQRPRSLTSTTRLSYVSLTAAALSSHSCT